MSTDRRILELQVENKFRIAAYTCIRRISGVAFAVVPDRKCVERPEPAFHPHCTHNK